MFYRNMCVNLIIRKVFVRSIRLFLTCNHRLNTCVYHAEAAFVDFWKRSLSPTGRFALVLYARWCVQCISRSSFSVDRDSSGGAKRAASSTAALVPGLTEPVLASRSKYTESFSLEVRVEPDRLYVEANHSYEYCANASLHSLTRLACARQLKCTSVRVLAALQIWSDARRPARAAARAAHARRDPTERGSRSPAVSRVLHARLAPRRG